MQQAGRDLVLAVVHAAQQPGSYTLLPGSPPDAAPPGFFLGLAGIGYTCLRFAQHDGERLPLVLLWE
jgi:lantibiotic modifying enzyme